jgi:hypothetical protein
MLVVKSIQVRSLSIEYLEISWTVESTNKDVLDYNFQVLRSEGPMGPFDEVSEKFEDRYIYVDNSVKPHNKFRSCFYIVRVTDKRTGEFKDYGPENDRIPPDLIVLELRKHRNLALKEFEGQRCWVLPLRTFGQRCSCFNTTLQKKTRSGCRTCYDTSFVGGFHYPIESWISVDPTANAEQQSSMGVLQQQNTTGICGYFPPMKPGDVVITPKNERWVVTSVSTPQHGGQPIFQQLQLHMLPNGAIEHAIELKMEGALKDIYMIPPRQYTNPYQRENIDPKNYAAIAQLYGVK